MLRKKGVKRIDRKTFYAAYVSTMLFHSLYFRIIRDESKMCMVFFAYILYVMWWEPEHGCNFGGFFFRVCHTSSCGLLYLFSYFILNKVWLYSLLKSIMDYLVWRLIKCCYVWEILINFQFYRMKDSTKKMTCQAKYILRKNDIAPDILPAKSITKRKSEESLTVATGSYVIRMYKGINE